jgi:hypothetical protein
VKGWTRSRTYANSFAGSCTTCTETGRPLRLPEAGRVGGRALVSSLPSSWTLAVARPKAPLPGARIASTLLWMFCRYPGNSLATSTSWLKITQPMPPAAAMVTIITRPTAGAPAQANLRQPSHGRRQYEGQCDGECERNQDLPCQIQHGYYAIRIPAVRTPGEKD